jgi:predicted DNA-binding transcriptional regulator AlpA
VTTGTKTALLTSAAGTGYQDQDEVFLTAPQVRRRYGGLSDMALWRWLNNPALGFPQPVDIGGRRYFKLSELQKFETQAAVRRAERPSPLNARRKLAAQGRHDGDAA